MPVICENFYRSPGLFGTDSEFMSRLLHEDREMETFYLYDDEYPGDLVLKVIPSTQMKIKGGKSV